MTLKMLNVSVKRGNTAVLNNLHCELSPGQIVGLVGPNGTGKSTFINAVVGLFAYTGQISWQEKKVDMKTVGFMPQHCQVRADLTVVETVLLGMHERLGLRISSDFLDQAINILEEFGIAHLHARSMQSLSGGQQQLVILAQRLIRRPDLLLLDEATSALDISHQMRVFDQLQSYVEKTNALVIIAIHDLNLAARHAQTVLLLGRGSIIGQGEFNSVITEKSLRDVYGIHSEIIQSATGRTAVLPICAAY
ncbi:ABC transporter ATP-binding protein [Brucella sp. 21LCYQ03]|nr:ABC transporter ATP-binding protein [Brucella sp. 21LCYQ03]